MFEVSYERLYHGAIDISLLEKWADRNGFSKVTFGDSEIHPLLPC